MRPHDGGPDLMQAGVGLLRVGLPTVIVDRQAIAVAQVIGIDPGPCSVDDLERRGGLDPQRLRIDRLDRRLFVGLARGIDVSVGLGQGTETLGIGQSRPEIAVFIHG